ncbi:MAG: hypothetical protein J6Z43_04990 [Clostridiales bacterium]|nr:hypothetical protein [Clostridiales bacterium]
MVISVRKFIYKFIAAVSVVSVAFNCCGCSAFLEGLAVSKIESMVSEAFTEYFESKGTSDISRYCKKKTDLSGYTAEQTELFNKALSKTTFEIVETTVKENRESGTCTIQFKKAPDMSKWDLWIATADEYESALSSIKRKTVKISFKVSRNEDGDWQFDNLDKFYSVFMSSFKDLCFLNEDGSPINITDKYIESFYVDSAWYDEKMGNPLESLSVSSVGSLTCVFYFNSPMNLNVTAVLYKDGDEEDTMDITVEDSVVAHCCFLSDSDTFARGTYKIAICLGDSVIAESAELAVR